MLVDQLFAWLELAIRWTHVVIGAAWIGASFYFNWLDSKLNVPPRDPEHNDVAGDLWAVHSGGFYHAQKYREPPNELPAPLHWFKWEAYGTWLSGFALLVVVYYLNAELYLYDAAESPLNSTTAAIALSAGLLLGMWVLYDRLTILVDHDTLLALIGSAILLATTWSLSMLFSGRGMVIQTGAILGTLMVGNVFRVIIPAQRQLVSARLADQPVDVRLARQAKRRSIHNNYLTLPVFFTMLGSHYPMIYASELSWVILLALFAVGVLVRHAINRRNRNGRWLPSVLGSGTVIIITVLLLQWVSVQKAAGDRQKLESADIRSIVDARCVPCHSVSPTFPGFPIAAAGVVLDTRTDLERWAQRVRYRTSVTRTMPVNNVTAMTEVERAQISAWQPTSGL